MPMNSNQKYWLIFSAIALVVLLIVLSDVLFPFIMALAIAYLADPLVDKLEDRGINRTLGVSICFGFMSVFLVIFLIAIIPMLAHQFKVLAELGPIAMQRFEFEFIPWLQSQTTIDFAGINMGKITSDIDWAATGGIITSILRNLTASGGVLLALVGNLVLIPVVAFYLLRDWDILIEKLDSLVPLNHLELVRVLASECNDVLKAFLRGQLMVMFALACIYTVGLMFVGLKLALLIGLIAGIASIVPYMGFIVGLGAALISALFQFQDISPLIAVIAVFSVGQMIEGMVLTPLLVGDKIGLHPVAVIFAILAGGQLFGFVGILIALPVAAVIMVLLRHMHGGYLSSDVYKPDGVTSFENELTQSRES